MFTFRRASILLPAAVAAVVALPAASHAATVQVVQTAAGGEGPDEYGAQFRAAPGERNDVTISQDGAFTVFKDSGAPLKAGDGCKAAAGGTVRCSDGGSEVTGIDVELGDGDDRATTTTSARLEGGKGNDVLNGGPEGDALKGGPGNDELHGGAGDDGLDGDGPNTTDAVKDPGADLLDGGPGNDLAFYRRNAGVTIDLTGAQPSGAPGENDRLADMENAQGGFGADKIIGTAGPNAISGGGGPDVVDGGGGDDILLGDTWETIDLNASTYAEQDSKLDGADTIRGGDGNDKIAANGGRDRVDAGAGDDVLFTSDLGVGPVREDPRTGPNRPVETTTCGTGADVVHESDFADMLTADCETVDFALGDKGVMAAQPAKVVVANGKASVVWTVTCRSTKQRCRFDLGLKAVGRFATKAKRPVYGIGMFNLAPKATKTLTIPLTSSAAALGAGKPLPVQVARYERPAKGKGGETLGGYEISLSATAPALTR